MLLGIQSSLGVNIIKNFTVEDGLPSSEVYTVYQDSRGYIWFCTDRGVSVYDGYSFTNYSTDDGLSYNTIFRIIEGPNGNLWLTGFNGTLTYWDIKTEKFYRYENNAALQAELGSYNWVHVIDFKGDSMLIYPYMHNKVYLGVRGDSGITELEVEKYPAETKKLLGQDKRNSNIYLIGKGSVHYPYYNVVRSRSVITNLADLDTMEEIFRKLNEKVLITDIYYYEGKYMLCSHDGLYTYQGSKLLDYDLAGTVVSGILKDNEGNLWITTTNKGVFVARFDDIHSYEVKELLMNGEKITNLTEFNGHLLLGTNRSRIIDYTTGEILCSHISTSNIHSFYERNDTLFSSFGMTIVKQGKGVRAIYNDNLKSRYIIIPTENNNLFYTSFNSFGFTQGDTISNVKTGRVLYAYKSKNGSIYFSKFTGLWEIKGNDLRNIIDHTRSMGVEHTTVRGILDFGPDALLLSTSGSGIVIVRGDSVITKVNKKHGLPSNMINACLIDEEYKRIWCATNRGVSILDYRLDSRGFRIVGVVNLNKSHGLVSNYINSALIRGEYVILAGDHSMSSIPRDFRLERVDAPVVNILSLVSREGNNTEGRTEFSHKENDFEIFYNAYSLQRPLDGTFYKYRLRSGKAKDQKWTYTNDRGVWFKNLDAGEYVFEVSARSLNSNWSPLQQVEFRVKPYFFEIWWVRLGLLVIVLALVFILVRQYFLRLQKESDKVLQINKLQLRNHELELAALRGQMNPHFVFNALKSIQNLILTEKKWEANNLLTKFSKLIRSSLEYSRTDFIPLSNEAEFLRNYLEIEKSRTPGKFSFRIDLDAVHDTQEIKIPGLLIQPICENAIKHAFHDEEGGVLEVIYTQDTDEGIIVVVRDNGIGYYNAVPRNSAMQHSMGLDIVRSRLALFREQGYDAWLKIEPLEKETQRGTIITLKLPSQ